MWRGLLESLRRGRWGFQWRYWRGKTPWDTHMTPPEVMEFIANTPAGKALDLGCGTGTNAITLARHGWEVTGVDFAPKAIRIARRKFEAAGLPVELMQADVTDLSVLTGPYDYVLDIGCLSGLGPPKRVPYGEELARLARSQGWYMLYAWLPRWWQGGIWGISAEEVEALIGGQFSKVRQVIGEEKGHPSAWYWFQRR